MNSMNIPKKETARTSQKEKKRIQKLVYDQEKILTGFYFHQDTSDTDSEMSYRDMVEENY